MSDAWKLDLLEARFLNHNARYARTKRLLTAKSSRSNAKLWRKLPQSREEAVPLISSLKAQLFERKIHAAVRRLEREVKHVLDERARRADASEALKKVQGLVGLLVRSRLVKVLVTVCGNEAKKSPPDYVSSEYRQGLTDKACEINPSHFFKSYCQDNPEVNGVISSVWNHKNVKRTLGDVEWSLRLVRGNVTSAEKKARREEKGEKDKKEGVSDDDSDEDSNDEIGEYDIADSEDSEEENDNEEEGSDDENSDFFNSGEDNASHDESSPPRKKVKTVALPQLASGYYSGGSDDESDPDKDEVVRAATQPRKNRRGQRARQLIWEKKYGREARHIKERNAQIASERQRKQAEFEERQRKREARAQSGANVVPLGVRGSAEPAASETDKATSADKSTATARMHPSWEAKKRAEEKQKGAKFMGKKITFD